MIHSSKSHQGQKSENAGRRRGFWSSTATGLSAPGPDFDVSMSDLTAIRQEFLRTGKIAPGVRPMIQEAWKRCREYGIDPHVLTPQTFDSVFLKGARQTHRNLLEKAQPFLDQLHIAMGEKPHVLVLSDAQGRLLHAMIYGVPSGLRAATNGFEGASWHEKDVGCNAIGTCLATGTPLVLIGPEHYEDTFIGWTCIGIPLRGRDGKVIAALGLFVPNEFAETKAWGWALANAIEIEHALACGSSKIRPLPVGERDQAFNSLSGIMELLLPRLDILPTHARFIDEARRAVMAALRERERTNEKLRVNEERFQLIQRATNDVIWDWDLVSGELLWNDALETTFGYSPDKIPPTLVWWRDLLHPNDRERVVDSIHRMIANPAKEIWTEEYRLRHARGTWINVLDRGIISRDEDGRGVRMVGAMTDLTERARREDELHLAVQRFETLANIMPQIVWSTTPDGYPDYFNERWFEFTGMPREEGQGWNWKDYLHPEDRPRAVAVWQRSLTTGERYEVQYRVRRASDGAYRWFIARAMPIRDREGIVKRWFGTCTDIHDQRREEEKLEALVAERTARLKEQTRRLRNLAAELGSAEQRERRRLAALLHDDLQQVLVAAKMKLATLHRQVEDDNSLRAVEQAEAWIEEAVGTARDLSRELRPPALYEGGLIAALHWFASEIEERHRLKVEIVAGDLPPISDDTKALLFDCIRELLFNAAKYAGVDQASVSIRAERRRLCVAVVDHGSGFDVGSLSGPGQSNAFGLFSIRERLAALDGELTIESAPGKGTRVDLEVPLSETGGPRVPAPLIPVKGGHRRRTAMTTDQRIRIVVVDDHATVREGIAAILNADERLNVVGQARDGIEAIECAGRAQADVILLDLNMPRMNGIEATREIINRWPEMIVIGLSVQDDETTKQAMIAAGAVAFLPKAGDADQLVASILALAAHDPKPAADDS